MRAKPAPGRPRRAVSRRVVVTAGLSAALAVSAASGLVGADAATGQAGSAPTLRLELPGHHLHLGTAMNARALESDPRYGPTAAAQFNMMTTEGEMRWAYTEPQLGVRDFSAADKLVDYARANRMKVRGHNLVWHDENPQWLEDGQFDRDQLKSILRAHILAVVGHFRGRVSQWDVVNEPLDADGSFRDSVWLRGIGAGYIGLAFRWAHQADPSARLFINDYSLESPGPKLDGMVRLVSRLRARGVPIGGVGFQCHFGLGSAITSTTGGSLESAMKRFDDLGVRTAVTELDVSISADPSSDELRDQGAVYGRVLAACMHTRTCHTVVVWGFTDAHSWIPSVNPSKGAATLFDADYEPKPAYSTWMRSLASSI